jgi:hypothetical protein
MESTQKKSSNIPVRKGDRIKQIFAFVSMAGFANVRLQMNNRKGAIEPLEKLVKLHGDRADYKVLLGQAKGKK